MQAGNRPHDSEGNRATSGAEQSIAVLVVNAQRSRSDVPDLADLGHRCCQRSQELPEPAQALDPTVVVVGRHRHPLAVQQQTPAPARGLGSEHGREGRSVDVAMQAHGCFETLVETFESHGGATHRTIVRSEHPPGDAAHEPQIRSRPCIALNAALGPVGEEDEPRRGPAYVLCTHLVRSRLPVLDPCSLVTS